MRTERWQLGEGARRRAPFAGGPDVEIVVGADSGQAVGVLEVVLPVGCAMAEHDHGDSAVLLVPLAGRLQLIEGGEDGRASELEPGVLATIPAGQRVRLENAGADEARTLAVLTPPDFVKGIESWPPAEPPPAA